MKVGLQRLQRKIRAYCRRIFEKREMVFLLELLGDFGHIDRNLRSPFEGSIVGALL
jgi:hypothetical protein